MRRAGPQLNRRSALGLGGAAIATAAGAARLDGLAAGAGGAPSEVILSEGTNIAVAVSRDGKRIAFDLLGLLWIVPIKGGRARCITDAFADLGQPSWSPDGKRILFQSYRSNNFHICTVSADGSKLRQLTSGFFDHREPSFAPDGRSIIFSSDRTGSYAIHRLDLASGAVTRISHGTGQHSEPCFSRDGSRFAYVEDGMKIMLGDFSGRVETAASVTRSAERYRWSQLHAPCFAPNGALAYVRSVDSVMAQIIGDRAAVSGVDLYPFRASWTPEGDLIYAADGKIRRLSASGKSSVVAFTAGAAVTRPTYPSRRRDFASTKPRPVIGIGSPMLSPDGRGIAFRALNDIYVVTIGDPTPRRLIEGPFFKCDPAWSPDGKWLAYSTDKGGTLDIWLHELATGTERQLTNMPGDAAVSANWSRDGKWICFLNQEGALHVVEVATGAIKQHYEALWEPGRPSFGPDGRTIAYSAFKPVSARYREGLSEILTVDRATGKGTYRPIAPGKSIATRGDDGPVWSPDGKYLAYIFASNLWVQPVEASGAFAGKPRRLASEASDAPSWSGDGRTLLYLSNGKLRLVSVDGGAARAIPFSMSWAVPKRTERKLVAGARIWDGIAAGYIDADVVVEGHRIGGVVERGSATAEGLTRIDGSNLTLLPGLVDMHTHRQMQGYGYGDRMGRLFLAMGVTATRSPGGPAYQTVEDREAIDSGARVAPRHFACGEALDGSRIYYNFMRPVTEPGQMALELERAQALSYDLLKTYVRMDHRDQAKVIRAGHRMGVHSSSHYHYPSLRNGMDCVEHLGSTTRYGYSRTVTGVGSGYEDVTKLFAAAKAGRTPTLFSAQVLIAEDPGLIEDPRIKLLFPAWEYAKLAERYAVITKSDLARPLASLERNVQQIKDMMKLGWHVLSGTDAPIDFVAISLHLNLRALTRFGISPREALLSATRHPGEFLHEPLGTIAPGRFADMILVEGDPLARIEDAAKVKLTIASGVAHTPESLAAPFANARTAIPVSQVEQLAKRSDDYFWQTADYVETGRRSCCAGHVLPA